MNTISRRGFLAGVAALSITGWRRVAVAAGYPAYWGDSLARAVARVSELGKTCSDGFWFITDLHCRHNACRSGLLLSELVRSSLLTNVICGGDLPVAFADGFASDREAVDFAIDTYCDKWVKPIRANGGKVYTAKGNHDFAVRHSIRPTEDRRAGFTYDGKKAHEVIMEGCTERDVVTNAADPTACYYYFDNASAKIRYIVVDSCDSERAGDISWGVIQGMHETQLIWLAGEAFATTPDGYSVVVVHHIPVSAALDKRYAPLYDLLKAYQNRGVYKVGKRKFGFKNARGRIILDLTGHKHCNMATFERGVLQVTTASDGYGNDNRAKWWSGQTASKEVGTSTEQAFDAIQLDPVRRLVHCTHVGGGGRDRTYHLDATTVEVGQRRSFATSLHGPITWLCHDANRVENVKSPTKRFLVVAKPRNDFATIDAEGVLTATAPGEIMVIARSANGTVEAFPVTVVSRKDPA